MAVAPIRVLDVLVEAIRVAVDADDADHQDIEFAREQRWPVGSGSAYPRFVRCGEGDHPRQINDEEACLLTLAMDGLGRFCLSERMRFERGEMYVRSRVLVRDGDELVVVEVVTPAEPA